VSPPKEEELFKQSLGLGLSESKEVANDEEHVSEEQKKEASSIESEVMGTVPSFASAKGSKRPPSARESGKS
jgi:hypothetical protein